MALLRFRRVLWWIPTLAVTLLLLLTLSACQRKTAEGRGLLPAAPPDQTTSAAPASAAPFNETLGNVGFARTVFRATGPSNIEIIVRDVVVGPHGEASPPASAGPVLIDLKSGSGSAAASGKTSDLSEQQPVSFPAGATITLKNTGDTPLMVRLYLLEGK